MLIYIIRTAIKTNRKSFIQFLLIIVLTRMFLKISNNDDKSHKTFKYFLVHHQFSTKVFFQEKTSQLFRYLPKRILLKMRERDEK